MLLTAQLKLYSKVYSQTVNCNIIVNVVGACVMTTITSPPISRWIYSLGSAANTMIFPLWTESYNSCGPFTFSAVDSITGLAIPNFLTLNSGTRTFTIGTASVSDVGIYNIKVTGSL